MKAWDEAEVCLSGLVLVRRGPSLEHAATNLPRHKILGIQGRCSCRALNLVVIRWCRLLVVQTDLPQCPWTFRAAGSITGSLVDKNLCRFTEICVRYPTPWRMSCRVHVSITFFFIFFCFLSSLSLIVEPVSQSMGTNGGSSKVFESLRAASQPGPWLAIRISCSEHQGLRSDQLFIAVEFTRTSSVAETLQSRSR